MLSLSYTLNCVNGNVSRGCCTQDCTLSLFDSYYDSDFTLYSNPFLRNKGGRDQILSDPPLTRKPNKDQNFRPTPWRCQFPSRRPAESSFRGTMSCDSKQRESTNATHNLENILKSHRILRHAHKTTKWKSVLHSRDTTRYACTLSKRRRTREPPCAENGD